MNDEFYVGYQPSAPHNLSKFVRRVVAGIVVGGAGIALVLAGAQAAFDASTFEFGKYQRVAGTLVTTPYPVLLMNGSSSLLVGEGKHGFDAKPGVATLEGSRIFRAEGRAIEVRSIETRPGAAPSSEEDLGAFTAVGEIVDTKCYFGVMNPGRGKVHRDCAARCISGGLPPAFLVRDQEGRVSTLLLTGTDGRPLGKEILGHVAEPIQVSGRLIRRADLLYLRADPANFHRH
jgi:hypothetical protein